MTAAFWGGWLGIDLRWRPGGVGISFACGNVGRRKRARNAARGVVADEAWRNREALLPLVDWGPARTRGMRGLSVSRRSDWGSRQNFIKRRRFARLRRNACRWLFRRLLKMKRREIKSDRKFRFSRKKRKFQGLQSLWGKG